MKSQERKPKLCVRSAGDYTQYRSICRKVKEGDNEAMEKAANLLCRFVKQNDVLVPVPGRFGQALYTLSLAIRIAYKTGCKIENCLYGEQRESLCDLKQEERPLFEPEFKKKYMVPAKRHYILLDNVYDTGRTAMAARQALGRRCSVLVIGRTNNRYNEEHND